jgi:polysaccharide pyruvyl transferase WcaK-like protein
MKLGIIGSYGGSSIGDEAILKGLLESLNASKLEIEEVVIYASNSNNTKTALGRLDCRFSIAFKSLHTAPSISPANTLEKTIAVKRKVIQYLKRYPSFFRFEKLYRKFANKPYIIDAISDAGLDVLIFGGGNLLMDLYPKWPYIVEQILVQAKKSGTKVYFMGVGAGPIDTSFGKKVFEMVANQYFVSTRDQESATYLEKHLKVTKDIKVGTDLAFGLTADNFPESQKSGIGITVVPYLADYYWPKTDMDKYHHYCVNMARILDEVVKDFFEEAEFFATNYPFDLMAASDIKSLMKHGEKVKLNEEKMNVEELLKYVRNKRYIIGTRLHSLILSACGSTDFFGVNYQPKVGYFLNRLGKEYDYINIDILERELSAIEINRVSSIILQSYHNRRYEHIKSYRDEQRNHLIKEMEEALDTRVKI